MPTLILFDIDGTLLRTAGSGIAAMGRAGRALYGDHFDERRVEYAGRLDPLIMADLLSLHGIEPTPAEMARFRSAYREHLERLMHEPAAGAGPCPGIIELLDALQSVRDVALGVLTGNYPETGAIKLRACRVAPERFPIAVWGCDSPHHPPAREHLPPVGMQRYAERFGRPIHASSVVIVGDTPHDVAAARAHGCRSLAVATGKFSVDELRAAGADRADPALTATAEIVQWMLAHP